MLSSSIRAASGSSVHSSCSRHSCTWSRTSLSQSNCESRCDMIMPSNRSSTKRQIEKRGSNARAARERKISECPTGLMAREFQLSNAASPRDRALAHVTFARGCKINLQRMRHRLTHKHVRMLVCKTLGAKASRLRIPETRLTFPRRSFPQIRHSRQIQLDIAHPTREG